MTRLILARASAINRKRFANEHHDTANLVPACIGYLFGFTIAGVHQLSEDTMRHLNRLADMADSFVESNLAAAIGVLTLAAVLWSAFK